MCWFQLITTDVFKCIASFQHGEYPLNSGNTPKGPILHLSNVRKEDSGTYICTANNGVGSMSADDIELVVYCELYVLVCSIVCAINLWIPTPSSIVDRSVIYFYKYNFLKI